MSGGPRASRWLALAALALALLPAAPPARADGGTAAPPRAQETFDVVWEKLRGSHFDAGEQRVDWAALEATHRPAITGARDLPTLRREINRLLRAVEVSHLALIPAGVLPTDRRKPRPSAGQAGVLAELGLRVAVLEGALHVLQVQPGSAAAQAGIGTGWQVEAIDDWRLDETLGGLAAMPEGRDRELARRQLEMHANGRLDGLAVGEQVSLQLRDGNGQTRQARLAARAAEGTTIRMVPGMPEQTARYNARRVVLADGGCALQVAFDAWAQPAFSGLVGSLREHPDCDRLVLDLRGNPGGQIWTLTAIAGLLYEQATELGTLETADARLKLAVLPRTVAEDGSRLRTLHGPVAVLVDGGSASCSEIFAAALQATGRARVFGERSAGMALPAMTARLPSGDWLYFPTADLRAPDGRRIEGQGVLPDEPARASVADLLAGRDPALEAAFDWLSQQRPGPAP